MSFELVLTSVPKGLKPGSRGFAAVAFTEGMPSNYIELCESLSGYAHVFTPEDTDNYERNPVVFSHLLAVRGGKEFSILSRIAAYGTDYTGRTNKLAHHILLAPDERPECGPAIALTLGNAPFFTQWTEPPRMLRENRAQVSGATPASLCAVTWGRALGDPGYAGMVAQSYLDAPSRPVFFVFEPGMDLLPLFSEVQALLPVQKRWGVTYSTYFTSVHHGMDCAWRACLPGSEALTASRRIPNAIVVDLLKQTVTPQPAGNSCLIDSARTGQAPPAAVLSHAEVTADTEPPQAPLRSMRSMPSKAKEPPPIHPVRSSGPTALPREPPVVASRWRAVALGAAALLVTVLGIYLLVSHRAVNTPVRSVGTGSPTNLPSPSSPGTPGTISMPPAMQAVSLDNPALDDSVAPTDRPSESVVSPTQATDERDRPQPVPAIDKWELTELTDLPKEFVPTFYDRDGCAIQAAKHPGIAGELGSYRASERSGAGTTLAKIVKAPRNPALLKLEAVAEDKVQMILITEAGSTKGRLYWNPGFKATAERHEKKLTLRVPASPAGTNLCSCIKEAPGELRLIVSIPGSLCLTQSLNTVDVGAIIDAQTLEINLPLEQRLAEQMDSDKTDVTNEMQELQNKLRPMELFRAESGEKTNQLGMAVSRWKNGKKDATEEERKNSEEGVRKGCVDLLLLSIPSESAEPAIQDPRIGWYNKPALKNKIDEAGKGDTGFTGKLSRRDPTSVKSLLDYVEGKSLVTFAESLLEDMGHLGSVVQSREATLQRDLADLEAKMVKLQKALLSVDLTLGQRHVIGGPIQQCEP